RTTARRRAGRRTTSSVHVKTAQRPGKIRAMITQAASTAALSELVGYAEDEWRRWKHWFDQHPAALDVPIAIAEAKEVRGLIKHIVLVDLRYAQWLLGEALTPPDGLDHLTTKALFEEGDRAYALLRRL